ncbi:VTT domain-containing protein [Cecembia sp.]|uniref:TVP38/TMEM64 family protein n=1 Tax=Cecembia sp. TaxID=1898110 RepID=UPI0025B8993B|nr:VTT domain-containing protein [Cecembia sp.]
MEKKRGIFKEFREASRINPLMASAILWVSLMPALGSTVLVPLALSNSALLSEMNFYHPFTGLLALGVAVALMGFALIPTTMLAGLSGFLLGWNAFPWLVLGYTLATLLGYAWGKSLSEDSLAFLLEKYPKAKKLLDQKKGEIGTLIFFVRLSPIIPFALSNLLFALLRSGWKKLVLFGTIGMLPRTSLVFFSGTLASDIYAAIRSEGISGKGWIFLGLLALSIWGIWRFFRKDNH